MGVISSPGLCNIGPGTVHETRPQQVIYNQHLVQVVQPVYEILTFLNFGEKNLVFSLKIMLLVCFWIYKIKWTVWTSRTSIDYQRLSTRTAQDST